jgi:pimeloyl-ACP methyl ester carboxylesterase
MSDSNTTAPTLFVQTPKERYAYRRLGARNGRTLLLLQHFTGTLDNWDPLVTDALAVNYDVIMFENAGVGRSSGTVPSTIAGMAEHAFAFLDALGVATCDVLGFSLGGMVAQQMALERPGLIGKMILVGTAPRGGEDIMHLDKPSLARHFQDPTLKGYDIFKKLFFAPTTTSQAAGQAFIERLLRRSGEREPASGPAVVQAQLSAFREWESFTGERFGDLHKIHHPTLIINGVHDELIPVFNSYRLAEHLPNAVLLTYPDAGHGSFYQWPESFLHQASSFLASKSADAPY